MEHQGVPQQSAVVKRSSWPSSIVLPPPALHWFDCKLLVAVLSIMLLCWYCISNDKGASIELLNSSAHLLSPHSIMYGSIPVHSSVVHVDLAAEVMLLEISVQQHGGQLEELCSGRSSTTFELAVGTAAPQATPASAVLPLCPALVDSLAVAAASGAAGGYHAVYTVPIPLVHTNEHVSPWEELTADVKFALRCGGKPCSSHDVPGVIWTGNWASDNMQLSVERHMGPLEAQTLDAGMAYPLDEQSVGMMEALGFHTPSSEAAFRVHLMRSAGVRTLQAFAAMVQVGFICHCLLLAVGQVVWTFVMGRFLTTHWHATRHSIYW